MPPSESLASTYRHPVLEAPSQPVRARASLMLEGPEMLEAVVLSEGVAVVVGRAADVILSDPSLSRFHARFVLRNNIVTVEDMGSTNGVQYEGERVARVDLEDGETVVLGAIRATVSGVSRSSQAGHLRSWSAFRNAAEAELERSRVFGRPTAFVGLRTEAPDDWELLAANLRTVDLAHVYTPDLALVLLPETPREAALEIARNLSMRLGGQLIVRVAVFPEVASHFEELLDRLTHALRAGQTRGVELVQGAAAASEPHGPIVVSERMQRLYGLVDRIARSTLPVLVLGETGAGKELVARAVHDRSPRAQGPFVAINCASIPTSLIESVLFGHERGAFTGANERKLGVFEQAHRGTVFLDEVGELAPQVQAALLRVLETKRVMRVGSTKETEVDVRVVAATHRDLSTMVAGGTFREDLMFRLDAFSLRVPPLRERVEEIEPLAERFLRKARESWGGTARSFSSEARSAIRNYRWPGNVRELKNVVERAAVVCVGSEVGLDDLPEAMASSACAEPLLASSSAAPSGGAAAGAPAIAQTLDPSERAETYEERVRAFETALIRDALQRVDGNQTRAAALLKIPRRTLTSKIHALGLKA